jgi:hypothetical protein
MPLCKREITAEEKKNVFKRIFQKDKKDKSRRNLKKNFTLG